MIRINLLGDKVDYAVVIATHALIFSVAMFFVITACVMSFTSIRGAVVEARQERDDLKIELAKLKKITAEVEDLEKKKVTLREKLMTIAQLKAKKQGPVRILDAINVSLPEQAWLTGIKEKGGFLEISGSALDNETIAKYMSDLAKSDYIEGVDLVQSKQIIKDEVPIKEFGLRAELSTALGVAARQSGQSGQTEQAATAENPASDAPVDEEKLRQEMLQKLLKQLEQNESAS